MVCFMVFFFSLVVITSTYCEFSWLKRYFFIEVPNAVRRSKYSLSGDDGSPAHVFSVPKQHHLPRPFMCHCIHAIDHTLPLRLISFLFSMVCACRSFATFT